MSCPFPLILAWSCKIREQTARLLGKFCFGFKDFPKQLIPVTSDRFDILGSQELPVILTNHLSSKIGSPKMDRAYGTTTPIPSGSLKLYECIDERES